MPLLIIVCIFLSQFPATVLAQCTVGTTATFTGSGTFGTGAATATYTGNPATACTIIVPSGITITINGNTTWNGNLQIAGTVILSQRLTLGTSSGCGLKVILEPGGKISDDPSGSGSNERLVICNKTILTTQPNPPSGAFNWPTPAGTGYTGPGSIDENFNGALPITLAYFRGAYMDNEVALSWATTSEENFDYFDLQRSTDGKEFQSIISVKGTGEKNVVTKYAYIDYPEHSGRFYYRLKSIDYDEKFEYSQIVSVMVGEVDIIAYPNPVDDGKLKIRGLSGPVQFVLTDQMGRVLLNSTLQSGQNEIVLNDTVSSGIYFLNIIGIGYSKMLKVQIL